MIGFLLRSRQDDICFTRVDKGQDISSFHYLPGMKMLNVIYADESEEAFTSEITEGLHNALMERSQILVAEINADGDLEREYMTQLTRA